MAELQLLIDQGNTRLKWVQAKNGVLDEQSANRGDWRAFRRAFQRDGSFQPDSVRVSSVTSPEAVRQLQAFCESHWGLEAQLLQSTRQCAGVRSAYSKPETLGVDRWLAIVGAVACYGKPVVIWDLGTASTLDAVDATGQHIGGMIYPGPATMLAALARHTELKVPGSLENTALTPGRSTAACISHGVLAAQLGALNQFLRATSKEIGAEAKLVVTGGAAQEILPLLDFDCIHDQWLIFRGMLAG